MISSGKGVIRLAVVLSFFDGRIPCVLLVAIFFFCPFFIGSFLLSRISALASDFSSVTPRNMTAFAQTGPLSFVLDKTRLITPFWRCLSHSTDDEPSARYPLERQKPYLCLREHDPDELLPSLFSHERECRASPAPPSLSTHPGRDARQTRGGLC
jgi:hypothetical protein